MANIKSYPNNQDEYIGAEQVMKFHHGRTSGVYGADGELVVAAVQGTMTVTVSDGDGWMANSEGDGIHFWIDHEKRNGSKLQLTVDPADSTLNRIDRVVVEWKTTNYVDLPEVKILKGALASSPTPPALTNNSTVRQLSLARISIAAGTTALTNSMITDERFDPAVCGIVTETVQVDTSGINNQVQAVLTETQAQAAAVLKAIGDELAELEGGTGVELKKLVFEDVAVSSANFTADTTYEDFPYRAAISLDGVIESMIPSVTLSVADALSGNIAPVAETFNGGVYLYAASVPEADMTIPTIICWKGGA